MGKASMNAANSKNTYIAAGIAGALVFLFGIASKGFFAALLLGLIAALLLGALLVWLGAPVPQLTALKPSPIPAPKVTPQAPVAQEPASDPVIAPDVAAPASVAEKPAEAPLITASKPLAGEQELASRKGSWRYEAVADEQRPEARDRPAGGADDLRQIKGIGPALEAQLNELGVWSFEQIAEWNAPEIAWMDDNLKGFRGRVSRDDWVGQARTLASGARTGAS
ncbi:endonuclease [Salipiger sp. 1_MG-2023]|uniref:endonuclease n=1 Tax=Salipiger sp. 1_MG-2023 TaxID=3062665 RepID=UPI0026E27937|nr:endonuclease [Salipiger sp. 1_MG-2023]MDO6584962.1 endonuclease [Salipiger sp. 1_MG-2023]